MVRQIDPRTGQVVPFGTPSPLPVTMRGLGDVVARVTQAAGIPSCAPCDERQARLNKLWPFGAPRSQ